jgi:sarcosine oxidase, subunit gamma
LRLEELPFLGQVNLRIDATNAPTDDADFTLGASLPLEPNTVARAGGLTVLWLGPDEWLVIGPPLAADGIETLLRSAAGDRPVSLVDVSAERTTLLVAGPRARDLLAHGCSLDLHPREFGPGRCAQTTLAGVPVVLVALEAVDELVFWVLVPASFAAYLAEWLLDAGTEYLGA